MERFAMTVPLYEQFRPPYPAKFFRARCPQVGPSQGPSAPLFHYEEIADWFRQSTTSACTIQLA